MKTRMFLAYVLLATGCATAVLAEAADDHKKLMQEYYEKFGPPGPEHKQLEPLVGVWQAKCKMWFDPAGEPQVSDGTLTRKSIMGGRFLQEEYDGKFMDKPFQGCGTMGYDRGKKKWVSTWLDSASTAIHQGYGTYDDSAKTWTFKQEDDCPITGKRVRLRDTLTIVGPDEQRMEMYRQMGDEKEAKVMEITLTRKK